MKILGLFVDLLMMGIISLCDIQGLKVVGLLLLEKRHFEDFYHIRACSPIGHVNQIHLTKVFHPEP